jgi:citrate synthase
VGALFEVTEENLETGLRGVPVGYVTTSVVDPQQGLQYVGHPVHELVDRTAEEVIELLYRGRFGTTAEHAEFIKELHQRGVCNREALRYVSRLPRRGAPMQLLPMAIITSGIYELVGDYREDGLNLIAKIPTITAAVIRHHAGWGRLTRPDPRRGWIENFVQMMHPPGVDLKELIDIMRLFVILHFDHGGGNLSAFVGKATASGLEDMYGSVASAMLALAGPRHGAANQDALQLLVQLVEELGANPTDEQLEQSIRRRLKNRELIYGFGHAVLRVEDPRATVLYDLAEQKYGNHPLVRMALALRRVAPKVLKEDERISDPYANVDAISGALLSAAGFPYPHYFPLLFGLARTVGIAIQIIYERSEARGGKGTPIIRPKYIYRERTAQQGMVEEPLGPET